MAKEVKTNRVGLRVNHGQSFRRTVTIGDEKKPERVTLVFEPETPYDLTDQELKGCQDLLDGGLLVPWVEEERGDRAKRHAELKRQEARSVQHLPAGAPGERAAELELELAAAEDQIEALIAQVKKLGGKPCVDFEDDEECDDEDECEEEEHPNKRSVKIEDLELSEGTRAALREAGLTTRHKIEVYCEQGGDLTDIPGIGAAKATEITEALAQVE